MAELVEESPARYHPRVEAGLLVQVVRGGKTLLTKAKDLSMAGLFLMGLRAEEGERIVLQLDLPGDLQVTTYAEVKRRRAQGCAVEFQDLDWDDLFALARFLHPRLP